jgi:hypothetical protein
VDITTNLATHGDDWSAPARALSLDENSARGSYRSANPGCHAAAWNEKGISSQINDIHVAVKLRNCRLKCECLLGAALNLRISPSNVAATLMGKRRGWRLVSICAGAEILGRISRLLPHIRENWAWKFSFQGTVPTPTDTFLRPRSNVTPGRRPIQRREFRE